MTPNRSRSGHRGLPALTAAVLALSVAVSCGPDRGGRDAITREVFVETYVDLRVAALREGEDELEVRVRDSVLAAHGVTQEQMLDFAERRGADLAFMRDVWNEIEARLDSVPTPDGPSFRP